MITRRAFGLGVGGAVAVGVLGLPSIARPPIVKVIGFGSAGRNVMASMVQSGATGFEYIALGTHRDGSNRAAPGLRVAPVLLATSVGNRMIDHGQARPPEHPDRGRLEATLAGADLVLLVGGLSIDSDSGATVLVAEVARALGAVVVAVVTYEGRDHQGRQTAHAVRGFTELGVPIVFWPLERLHRSLGAPGPFATTDERRRAEARVGGEIARTARALGDLAPLTLGAMSAAFSLRAGTAVAGTAVGCAAEFGDDIGRVVAERAIRTPLVNLEAMLAHAAWVVVNVTCSSGSRAPVSALEAVRRVAPRRAPVVFGHVREDGLGDEVRVTVIAGGASVARERWWWKRRNREHRPTG